MNGIPEVAYFDTGVFVTPILRNRSESVVSKCLEWQRLMKAGTVRAITSYLTWDEVTYLVRRHISSDAAAQTGRKLLSLENLEFAPVDGNVMEVAQMVFERWRTKPRDAIHASSALIKAAGTIVTLDVSDSDYRRLRRDDGTQLLSLVEVV